MHVLLVWKICIPPTVSCTMISCFKSSWLPYGTWPERTSFSAIESQIMTWTCWGSMSNNMYGPQNVLMSAKV